MSEQDYADGWARGMAGLDPELERLALGANRLNDYERGYIDSGNPDKQLLPGVANRGQPVVSSSRTQHP